MLIRLIFLFFCVNSAIYANPDFTQYAFTLEITERNEKSRIGTGCIVESRGSFYYVTAHHIFSDMTDMHRASLVKRISIVSESHPRARFHVAEFIPVANAKELTNKDVMIYKMKTAPDIAAYSVSLAPTAPLKDEIVYLSASLPNFPAATYSLKILAVSDDYVEYEKIPGIIRYTGASGGPILNSNGQLVGTYLGRSLVKANEPDIRCLLGTPLVSLINIFDSIK